MPTLRIKHPNSKDPGKKSYEYVEIQRAINLYLKECGVSRFSFFKRKALYSRPWFLVIGPEKSGKSTLFTHAGIDFPVMYPTVDDGYIPGESTQPSIVWWFDQEAVWLDLPGRLFLDENKKNLKDTMQSLQQVRSRCPVNGIVLVVPCNNFVEEDADVISELATSQRKIVEKLMHLWGLELPIYLIFSKTDKVKGFNELFFNANDKYNEQMLGASIDNTEAQRLPRLSFLENFESVTENLNNIRLRMLSSEADEERRTAMCRFPIDIASIREKATFFITTLFKQGTYSERPLFGGFYFTSCQNFIPSSNVIEPLHSGTKEIALKHPLSPHRKSKRLPKVSSHTKKQKHSFFLRPLLSTVIPGLSPIILSTGKRFRKDIVSLVLRIGIFSLIIIAAILFLFSSYVKIQKEVQHTSSILNTPLSYTTEGLEQFFKIDSLHTVYRQYLNGDRPPYMYITGYNYKKAFQTVDKMYIQKSRAFLIEPCLTEIEARIRNSLRYANDNFVSLKNDLRAYCILSDQRLQYPEIIKEDTLAVETLFSLFATRIIPEAAHANYDSSVHTILFRTISNLDTDTPTKLPQADTELVSRTQQRLVELMDNREVYSIIISQEKNRCDDLTIKTVIPDIPHASLLQSSQHLSEIYTPLYWQQRILPRFKSVNEEQQQIQRWVTGDHKSRSLPSGEYRNQQINELVGYYLDDVTRFWRDFLSTVSIQPFSSPQEAEESFRRIVAKKSPLDLLIKQFAQWSSEFTIEDTTLQLAPDIYKTFSKKNAHYEDFSTNYYPDYQKQLEKLADGLSKAISDKSFPITFNGSPEDPLVKTFRFMSTTIDPFLETESGGCLSLLLTSPINSIRSILVPLLVSELNNLWKKQVYQPFISQFNQKYPFPGAKEEASFESVRAFFHPTQGPLWNMINQYLSYRIAERGGEWIPLNENSESIPIVFSPRLPGSLLHAKSITSVFYALNGTPHQWEIDITAGNHTLKEARFTINGAAFEFGPGQLVKLTWPQSGRTVSGSISGKDQLGNTGNLSFSGQWSVMKLMNDICINNQTDHSSIFEIQWKIKAHAKFLVLPAKVKVTMQGNGHPLCRNMFRGFVLPEVLVLERKE